MTKRFYFKEPLKINRFYRLEGSLYNHIHNVLRLKEGEQIKLFDPLGQEFLCQLESKGSRLSAHVIQRVESNTKTLPKITLCQAIIRFSRMDLVVEKSTELGVTIIQPVICRRSVRLPRNPGARVERWRRIAGEASRQSKRTSVPDVREIINFNKFINLNHSGARKLLLLQEAQKSMKDVLRGTNEYERTVVIVGPEGGLEDSEIKGAEEQGFIPVNLGALTLRSETAGIIAVAILGYELGKLK